MQLKNIIGVNKISTGTAYHSINIKFLESITQWLCKN